jgi:hypothetical protein
MKRCKVVDGRVISNGTSYRVGESVELSDSEADRCVKLGVVSVFSVVVPEPVVAEPEVESTPEPEVAEPVKTNKPKRKNRKKK